ncbi:hypothetical protein GGR56DRAFT_357206 [Xylariaceae sp. FL0804]|nr:hypothetical protein GGR56DRAFT_357206 [Xylariaceae sp. FL0804]
MMRRVSRRKTVQGCGFGETQARTAGGSKRPDNTPPRPAPPPPVRVPRRRASLGRSSSPPAPPESSDHEMDPARKIWTEMRRTRSGSRPAFHVGRSVGRSPAATTFATTRGRDRASQPPAADLLPEPTRSEVRSRRQREGIWDGAAALRNRRSVGGADGLKRSLVPSMTPLPPAEDDAGGEADNDDGGLEEEDGEEEKAAAAASCTPPPSRGRRSDGHDVSGQGQGQGQGQGRKRETRWSLGGWW